MERRLPDWIDGYLKYMENEEPPEQWKLWAAISTVAACLQRKCYVVRGKEVIYPNMYIIIIGPSGLRKGVAMAPALALLRSLGIPLAAECVTREALIRSMVRATRAYMGPDGVPIAHASMTVYSPEFAVFIGGGNPQLLSDLTDWFDCRDPWVYETKSQGIDEIRGTFVNLIGATTPELLQSILPRDAIGGGLTSRMIFVYGSKKSRLVHWGVHDEGEKKLREDLEVDLEAILSMTGEFRVTQDFLDAYIEWYDESEKAPAVTDPNFRAYNSRRATHLVKLCMIVNASRSDNMVIGVEDFNRALGYLKHAERLMPYVYSGYGKSDVADVMKAVMREILVAGTDGVTRSQLLKMFWRDVSTTQLDDILRSLKQMKWIDVKDLESDIRVFRSKSEGPQVDIY